MPIRRWGAQDKAKACADDRHIGHHIRGSQGRLIRVQVDVVEVDIDGRSFWVRPVSPDVLQGGNVVVAALAEALGKPFPWAVGFFFGNTELSLELWTVIAGISGFDD